MSSVPKSERVTTLLDAVQEFVSAVFGPDEMPAMIHIDLRRETPGIKVVTDHGGRIALDTLRGPSCN